MWRINSLGVAEIVEDAVPGGGISPGNGNAGITSVVIVNAVLYFRANDAANGSELWRINIQGSLKWWRMLSLEEVSIQAR